MKLSQPMAVVTTILQNRWDHPIIPVLLSLLFNTNILSYLNLATTLATPLTCPQASSPQTPNPGMMPHHPRHGLEAALSYVLGGPQVLRTVEALWERSPQFGLSRVLAAPQAPSLPSMRHLLYTHCQNTTPVLRSWEASLEASTMGGQDRVSQSWVCEPVLHWESCKLWWSYLWSYSGLLFETGSIHKRKRT